MSKEIAAKSIHLRRNTIGGVIGNVLEWYDFAVYGFFAPIIGAQFFPTEDRLSSLIAAFGVFAAGYMMRPVRVADFGHRRHCCAGLLPDSHGVCRPRGDALEDPTRRGANVNTLPTVSGRARKLS